MSKLRALSNIIQALVSRTSSKAAVHVARRSQSAGKRERVDPGRQVAIKPSGLLKGDGGLSQRTASGPEALGASPAVRDRGDDAALGEHLHHDQHGKEYCEPATRRHE